MNRTILIATSSTLAGGGIGSYCALLCESLARQNYSPIVVSPAVTEGKSWSEHGATAAYVVGAQVDAEVGLRRIGEIIKHHQCLGIINNDHPYVQAYAPISAVPFLSICHFEDGVIGRLATENAHSMDYVVAISDDMRKRITGKRFVSEGQTKLVHTGISVNGIGDVGTDISRERIIYLGGGDRRKGADLVERLAKRLQRGAGVTPIEWFGHVSERQRSRLSKLQSVRLMGHQSREEVLSRLSEARYLLFPSRAEGCPMALLEAMAMGAIPICAAGRGAMKEIVSDSFDGFITPARDWVARAEGLLRNKLPDECLTELAVAAQKKVRNQFSIDQKACELLILLESPRVRRPTGQKFRVVYWHRLPRRPLPAGLIDSSRFRLGLLKRGSLRRC